MKQVRTIGRFVTADMIFISHIFLEVTVLLLTCFYSPNANADMMFKDTFDTLATANKDIYDTRYGNHRVSQGELVLSYSSEQPAAPSGIECITPRSAADPDERDIDLRFLGGGTEMSNSLFICYAIGPGDGLSLPPLPSRPSSNDRTGYIIRLIRHGDGTNEVKFYRNDGGWTKELKTDWTLSFNPITTLRRTFVRHRRDGEHIITATFDTGAVFDRTWTFEDGVYPPTNDQRCLQLIVKGHAGIQTLLEIRSDSWVVTDIPKASRDEKRTKTSMADKTSKVLPQSMDIPKILSNARRLYEQGSLLSAQELCTTMIAQDRKNADALDLLGMVLASMNDYSGAYKSVSEALHIRRQTLGAGHPKSAESLHHLAGLYRSKDIPEAERLYTESLSVVEKAPGADRSEVADILCDLADLYQTKGKYDKAEQSYTRALAIREKTQGMDRPEVADILYNLADIYQTQGKYDKTEQSYKRVLAIREKVLGPDHPAVAAILHKMEVFYENQGRDSEREWIYKRLIDLTEKTSGTDHPDVARRLNNLAGIYQNRGQYDRAEPLFKRSLAIMEKTQGREHPYLASMLYNLALMYQKEGKYTDAEVFYERALRIREKSLGADHSKLINIVHNMAELYMTLNKYYEAETMYKKELSIKEKTLGREHPYVADAINNLAALYFQEGRYAEAEPLFRRALKIKEKTLGPDHPEFLTILQNISFLYKKMNRPAEADYYAAKAKSLRHRK